MTAEKKPISNCGCGKHHVAPPDYYPVAFEASMASRQPFIDAYLDGLRKHLGRDFDEEEHVAAQRLAGERWDQFSGGSFHRWAEQRPRVVIKDLPQGLAAMWQSRPETESSS